MYGLNGLKNKWIKNVLQAEFDKKWKPKPGKNLLDCINSVDPTTLPPCSQVLLQQIKGACYLAQFYSAAYDTYPAFELLTYFLLTMVAS